MTRSDRISVCVVIYAVAVLPQQARTTTEIIAAGVVGLFVMAAFVFGKHGSSHHAQSAQRTEGG